MRVTIDRQSLIFPVSRSIGSSLSGAILARLCLCKERGNVRRKRRVADEALFHGVRGMAGLNLRRQHDASDESRR